MSLTPAEADAIDVMLTVWSRTAPRPILARYLVTPLEQLIAEHVGPDETLLDLHWTFVEGTHLSVRYELTATIPTTRRLLIAYVDDGIPPTATPVAYGTPVDHHWKPTRPRLNDGPNGPIVELGPGHSDLAAWVQQPPAHATWLPAAPAPGKWAPGWYPDPGHRHDLRWWDGSQWWARVVDRGREHRKLVTE